MTPVAERLSSDDAPQPERSRVPLAQRHALRDAIAYIAEGPDGEVGYVTAVRTAPFAYWPDELVVRADPAGPQLRVPVESISAVLPREGRLFVAAVRPRGARRTSARGWWLAATAGAVLGLGGYVATFAALVLDAGAEWGPGLTASGAVGGAAAAASLRTRGSSWPAAIGLGSFWLPLAAGAILSLILVFG
jgi:hypothetical protein